MPQWHASKQNQMDLVRPIRPICRTNGKTWRNSYNAVLYLLVDNRPVVSSRTTQYPAICERKTYDACDDKNPVRFKLDLILRGLRRWWRWGRFGSIHSSTAPNAHSAPSAITSTTECVYGGGHLSWILIRCRSGASSLKYRRVSKRVRHRNA